mmetsp:Transcript_56415/g.167929  ORF Transcript_56415/g.167929 Transcript_56415/m.167929 type:complete len:250 (+) Transcript_56415:62-811(+)
MALESGVAAAIGQQVEQMIIQAKKDSESRVQQELSMAHLQLRRMESVISELSDRVAERVRSRATPEASPKVDEAFLTQKISQLEQKWAAEMKALKQDLHRTILAHNHNSDLMRHHRDALDDARAKLDARVGPRAEQVDAQIEQVDRMLRARQAKYQALDALEERLAMLEQHAADAGLMLPRGPQPQLQAQPQACGGKGFMGEAGAGKGLNAEAPVFVPRSTAPTAEAEDSSGGEGAAAGAGAPPGLSPP